MTAYDFLFKKAKLASEEKILIYGASGAVGRLLLVAAGLPDMLSSLVANSSQSKKVCSGPVTEKAEDLQKIVDMVAVGVLKPLVGKVYAASSIGEAFTYVGQRHKRGNVVLDLTSL